MSPHFVPFGPSHLVAVALTLLVPLALAVVARLEHPGRRADRVARIALAAFLAAGWVGWYLVNGVEGHLDIGNALPLNLCDWADLALVVALLTRNRFAYELGYFWGLGGTLQGVITPTTYYDFPDPEFIFFFIEHGGIIAALLYLTLGTRMRPVAASLPRVIAATLFYAAFAGLMDWLLGVNYGFLRAKPLNISLLSLLSPWPWYIPELIAIGIVFVLIYYTPFALLDAVRKPPASGSAAKT